MISSARLAVLALCAVPLMALHTGSAHAYAGAEQHANNTQLLSCSILKVRDRPNLSAVQKTLDCSQSHNKKEATTATSG
ncbi:hypothetical protein SUDANB58_01706 [Streptomyces sp. enrichment culture]|uniref:hypothetical protein n=1 Tax=Streptomyces sp. enrichment culture TaxID=1795815 RepID=UPI003F54AAE1